MTPIWAARLVVLRAQPLGAGSGQHIVCRANPAIPGFKKQELDPGLKITGMTHGLKITGMTHGLKTTVVEQTR